MSLECTLRIGILAIQGAFAEHAHNLEGAFRLHQENEKVSSQTLDLIEVKKVDHLKNLDGLILPGGESTTMSKFLDRNGFKDELSSLSHANGAKTPVIWGTCAGLILLSDRVEDMKIGGQTLLGGLDITTSRNAYGRQIESFETSINIQDNGLIESSEIEDTCPGVFIRAPNIVSVEGEGVKVLATIERPKGQEKVVAVRQGKLMATSFHPELTDDLRWHLYFLRLILQHRHMTVIAS